MRASSFIPMRRVGVAASLLAVTATSAIAQLPNASAAAVGMGGNFTAIARGYEAVAWNPANLAMPGRPAFSLGLGIAGGHAGLDPLDLKSLAEFSGRVIDSVTRVSWLDQARVAGGQHGRMDGNLTPLALSVGPFALHVGSSIYTNLTLSPDAWEALLFGNAGNNGGQPKTLDLTGTRVRAAAFTTGGLSFALPIPINLTGGLLRNERAAIGITSKYVIGHGLFFAEDLGSTVGANDILLRFPVIGPDSASRGIAGVGNAADVALAWSGGPWRVGVLAENVFNSFAWDTTKLAFLPGTGSFSASSNSTDFDQQPYAAAPQVLRDIVAAQAFKPALAIGAALNVLSSLTLTADLKTYTGGDEAIVIGPRSHFGVGAEWRVLPFVPLRAGVASVTDGWQAGAGAGLRLMGYELGLSGSLRRRGAGTESGIMLGVVGIGR